MVDSLIRSVEDLVLLDDHERAWDDVFDDVQLAFNAGELTKRNYKYCIELLSRIVD